MTDTRSSSSPAVPERYGWALRLLLAFGLLFGLLISIQLVIQLVHLFSWLQPGARIPITTRTAYALPTAPGSTSYSGVPFVQDGTRVIATEVTTTLNGVPLGNRIALAVAPLLWTTTGLLVTLLLGQVVWHLARGASFGVRLSRPVVIAAAALAIGPSVAQVTQGASYLAFGRFAWPAPRGEDASLLRAGGVTFDFAPLLLACGLLAVALILRRGLALQRDIEGLV